MLPRRGYKIASSVNASSKKLLRNYAAAAAVPLTDPIEVDSVSPRPIQGAKKVTKLDNGLQVITIDNGGSVSRLAIGVEAGTRVEGAGQRGITHLLKNAAFQTNQQKSALALTRELQQFGAGLECSHTRELLVRNATFLRTHLANVLELIAPDITAPLLNHWDFGGVKSMTAAENAAVATDQTAGSIELLHKAAYRDGLGNGLYCDDLSIGGFKHDQVLEHHKAVHVGERMTVVGTDVNHEELVRYIRELLGGLPQGEAVAKSGQTYHGGEVHIKTANGLAHVALAAQGAGFNGDVASLAVLQQLLGGSNFLKWGSNTVSSRLNKAAHGVTTGPLLINAMNLCYSDSGLFGVYAIAQPQDVSAVMKAAVVEIAAVGNGEASEEEIDRARTQAASSAQMALENKNDVIEDILKKVTLTCNHDADALVDSINAVTAESVAEAAQGLLTGNATLVATGETAGSPYLSDLQI